MKIIAAFTFFLSSLLLCAQSTSPTSLYFKVDQFGYKPNSLKVAVISDPQIGFNNGLAFTPGTTLQLRNWFTDEVVFSGSPSLWNNGQVQDQSGDRGWWFDFSTITATGDYYIYDTTNNVRSHRFKIDDDIYSQVLKSATVMFYRNRCGNAKPASHNGSKWDDNNVNFQQDQQTRYLFDRNNPALFKDLSGGWFDAGDFNKYVTFTNNVIHDLLWAYQENPTVFGDNWNIPESNNNLPDILDEVKWELDWLMKMNNSDGTTHLKMGSLNHQENSSPLPSNNNDPRYYGPTCSSAEIFVAGIFAHAASVLGQFPSQVAYANELTSRAETTWLQVLPQVLDTMTLDINCDLSDPDNRIVSGDADVSKQEQVDMALKAAIYLWERTGKSTYKSYIDNNLYEAEPLSGFHWSLYKRPLHDALLHYTTLAGVSSADRNAIRNSFSSELNIHGYYGMNSGDLYRSYMPNSTYHWGSSQVKAVGGMMNLLAKNYNINPANATDYAQKAEEHVHYFHGLNPMGLTYLSNMYALGAEFPANEMFHQCFNHNTQWDNAITSTAGPAPGFLTGGPNFNTSVLLDPPSGQPHQKSYLDYNTGANQAWEITEPAIYYQSIYVRLLAAFSNSPSSCPGENTACNDGDPKTFNDVADGFCGCIGECPTAGTPCDDNDPFTLNDIENGACLCIGSLPEIDQTCTNRIKNGDFTSGLDHWLTWGCSISEVNGELQTDNIQVGVNDWDAGISQNALSLFGGRDYILTFKASASSSRMIAIQMRSGDGTSFYYEDEILINTTTQDFSFIFTSLESTADATVEFLIGIDGSDLTFDNIELIEVDCDLPGANCPNQVVNGDFTTDVNPWNSWSSTIAAINGKMQTSNIQLGINPWDAGISQTGLSLTGGSDYILNFQASATATRTVDIKIGFDDGSNIYYDGGFVISSTAEDYTVMFTNVANTTNASVEFLIGLNDADLTFDNIELKEIDCPAMEECPFDLIIDNPVENNLYQAENSILSDAIISQTSIVEFGAFNSVTLQPGFEVVNGNVFLASLNGCSQ